MKCMRMVFIHFAVRKNPWSNSFGSGNRLSGLTFFTDPERYYVELSIEVLTMNISGRVNGDFWLWKCGHFRGGDVASFLSNIGETFMGICRPAKAASK